MGGNPHIPLRLRELVYRELEDGESVESMERPIPRPFTLQTGGVFLAGIMLTGLSSFWMFVAVGTGALAGWSWPMLLPVPFLALGLSLLSVPLWAWRRDLNTVYVITNRRAITIIGGFSNTIRSYDPSKLQDIFRREKTNGSGDIVLERRSVRGTSHSHIEELGFLSVRDALAVERRLKKLAREA